MTEGDKQPDLIQYGEEEEAKAASTPKKVPNHIPPSVSSSVFEETPLETTLKMTENDLIVLSGPSNKSTYLPSDKPIKISENETLIPCFFSEKIETPAKVA